MPHNREIKLVFCWLLAALLLAVSASGRLVYNEPSFTDGIRKESPQPQQKGTTEETTVSPLTINAVVISSFSYHFSQYFLPAPLLSVGFPIESGATLPARFSDPLFFFSYFLKVFGKQIAPNAP